MEDVALKSGLLSIFNFSAVACLGIVGDAGEAQYFLQCTKPDMDKAIH